MTAGTDDLAESVSPWLSPAERAVKAAAAAQREKEAARRQRSVQITLALGAAGGPGVRCGSLRRKMSQRPQLQQWRRLLKRIQQRWPATEAAAAVAVAASVAAAAGCTSAHVGPCAQVTAPRRSTSRATAAPRWCQSGRFCCCHCCPAPSMWTSLFGSTRLQHDDPLALSVA